MSRKLALSGTSGPSSYPAIVTVEARSSAATISIYAHLLCHNLTFMHAASKRAGALTAVCMSY